jgi:transposase
MSKFSPHLGSCQWQFSKKVESLAPTVIPKGFLNQLGFAMWTPTTRQKHSRTVTRYQTDLTDTEWRVIAPHLPKPCAAGRPRGWPMREIVNGNVMRSGCPWRLVPSDLPPWGTIYRWFAAWRDDGRFERINHALVTADRERVGRDATPRPRSSTDDQYEFQNGL